MAKASSTGLSEELKKRLALSNTSLYITVSHEPIDKLISSSPESDVFLKIVRTLKKYSCAEVPISPLPGTGRNFVHEMGGPPNRDNSLSSATARLLDLQTMLELPLMILGIRMQPGDSNRFPSLPSEQIPLWPDAKIVKDITVMRIPRRCPETFTPTSAILSHTDLTNSVWDLTQPLNHDIVNIHLRFKDGVPIPRPDAQPHLAQLCAKFLKIAPGPQPSGNSTSTAPGSRKSDFTKLVASNAATLNCCAVTRTDDPIHICHIIGRTLGHELVVRVLELLFKKRDITQAEGTISPLFDENLDVGRIPSLDYHGNGALLSFFDIFMNGKQILEKAAAEAMDKDTADSLDKRRIKRPKPNPDRTGTGTQDNERPGTGNVTLEKSGTGGGTSEADSADRSFGSDHSNPSSGSDTAVSSSTSAEAKQVPKVTIESSRPQSSSDVLPTLRKRVRTDDDPARSRPTSLERQTSPVASLSSLHTVSEADSSESFYSDSDDECWDEEEEKRQERVRVDTFALLLILRAFGDESRNI
ncbi:hypothetical protein OC845_006786 [Tilletia horrida]|nr:hypothetical protein OC845_006786 [Tilletia horrida]